MATRAALRPAPGPAASTHAGLLFLREEQLRQVQELLFFAYRDFTGSADPVLEELGLGRAHHRVLYFVGARAGVTVTELLALLRITKQSLARVLGQLVVEGYVEHTRDAADRRQKHLALTEKGRTLERRLFASQRELLVAAFSEAGVDGVSMPGEDGVALTRALRAAHSDVPILLLTARGGPEDQIEGFEAGADDYLGKPFEPRVLLLRLRALLRRIAPPAPTENDRPVRLGSLEYDPVRGALRHDEGAVHLTGGEVALLTVLARKPGEIFSREELARVLDMDETGERAIDVQVTRLRRKIEPDPREPRFLHTVRGRGYVLKPGT